MKELVIFDLDGVIIKGQSQKIFLDYIFSRKMIGLFFYLKIYFWFILYKLGFVKNPKKIMEYAFSFLKNMEAGDLERITEVFLKQILCRCIFPEIVDIINEHKSKNRELLIVSNSADIFVEKVAKFLGINNYIGTKLEKQGEKFTGNISGNIVYGKNKVVAADNFAKNNNFELKNSWAYGDHISDLDLLLSVAKPCAVNPDKALLKEAQKRNWLILKFKK